MSASPTAVTNHPRLSVQAFWLAFSKLIAALLNIALPILLVRLMSQTEYGVFKQAFLFTGTAANVATMGLGMSAFYFMPRHPDRGGQIALNILIYNAIAGWIPLVVLALYPQVLRFLFRTNELVPLAFLLGVLVFLTLTASPLLVIPSALQDVRHSTIFIVGTQLARTIIMVVTVLLFHTVKSLIIASIVSQLISVAVLYWYLDDRFPRFWRQFDWGAFREQLAYALPYGAFGLLWVIQRDLDNYFVSAKLGPKDYAIYAVGWLDVPLISLLLESVMSVLTVRVGKLQQEDRKAEIRALTAEAANRLSAIQLPLFMMLMVAAHDLIVLLYTPAYERSVAIFRVSILLLPLGVLLSDPVVRAYKELRTFVLSVRIVTFVSLFTLLFPVIRHFGMLGAAILAVGARTMEFSIISWKAARTVDASLKDLALYRELFKVAGLTIAAGAVTYFAMSLIDPRLLILRIIVVGLCFGAIYLPGLIVFHLPGYELLSKERLMGFARSTLRRLRSQNA